MQCYDNETIDKIVYTQKTYSFFFEDKSVNVENYKIDVEKNFFLCFYGFVVQ